MLLQDGAGLIAGQLLEDCISGGPGTTLAPFHPVAILAGKEKAGYDRDLSASA
jgi:hypothetical protein